MRLLDSRRLTGRSLLLDGPGAIVEVALDEGDDFEAIAEAWGARLEAWLPRRPLRARRFEGGAAFVVGGFHDELLALCDVNEAAVLGGDPPLAALEAARDPALRALAAEAAARGIPLLVDDELVSLGLGARSQSWPRSALPDRVPDDVGRIPVALVTGTNGKTTCARLAGHLAVAAGRVAGVATTDGISVGGAIVARGDYTGPDAARLVLRDRNVELAVLETARGGILRRGLAVDDVDAALITNVGDDHLGLYGIDDVDTMTRVKAVVGCAVRRYGQVVVNADDERLARYASGDAPVPPFAWRAPVVRFSTRRWADWHVAGGQLARRGQPLLAIAEVPIAFGGAATYNVANALGAAALAAAVGVPDEAIVSGLRSFDAAHNPGRGTVRDVRGITVVLDFAHNPDSVRGLMALVGTLRKDGGRTIAVVGQPGDRRDDALRAVAGEIAAAGPSLVVLHELDGYLRGREPGAVPALLRNSFAGRGVPVEEAAGEAAALERALDAARPGDVVALFPLLDPAGVEAVIDRRLRATLDE